MFPLQQSSSNELLGFDLGQDDHASLENNSINFCSSNDSERTDDLGFRRRRWQKECSMRKVVLHREVERKRRQQMSNLKAPLHHQIKGHRSVGDEIEEVEGHIKKMEKNIELKNGRRDHWFKSSSSSSSSSSSNVDEISVAVNKIGSDGMEILIKTEDVKLSRVLAELQNIDDDLDVATIVSTRLINGKFLHKIQLQARDMKKLGVLMLQDRLMKAIM